MIINIYVSDGRTPRNGSVAITNGLIYNDVPGFVGIHASSVLTTALIASKKSSSGISGIQILRFVLLALSIFLLGRNNNVLPSSVLYAFNPSNISCP